MARATVDGLDREAIRRALARLRETPDLDTLVIRAGSVRLRSRSSLRARVARRGLPIERRFSVSRRGTA